jgi:hypothetical protein
MTRLSPRRKSMPRTLVILIVFFAFGFTAGTVPTDGGWGADPPPTLRP